MEGRLKAYATSGRVLVIAAVILSLVALPRAPARAAASFSVDSPLDTTDANPGDGFCDDGSGKCTLRAAIMEANKLAGADTITLQPITYTLTIAGPNEDAGATGDLDIIDPVTLVGATAGSARTVITAATGWDDRILDVHTTGAVTLQVLTVSGGNAPADEPGGGINAIATSATGSITLDDIVATNNRAAYGGGIAVGGTAAALTNITADHNSASSGGGLALEDSGSATLQWFNIHDNSVTSLGGGIYAVETPSVGPGWLLSNGSVSANQSGGQGGGVSTSQASLEDVTISDNTAANDGGGLANQGNNVTLTRVTVANNTVTSAQGHGGGIHDQGASIDLTNVTISHNHGGGLDTNSFSGHLANVTVLDNDGVGLEHFLGGTHTLQNVLAARNTVNSITVNCSGQWTLLGNNLEDGSSCGFDKFAADPKISDDLADNAVPGLPTPATQTHALLAGSPAIDAGATPCVDTDQRGQGYARPQDGDLNGSALCDIGAFELMPLASGPLNHPPVADNQTLTTLEDTQLAITLSASDPDGDPLTYQIVTQPSTGSLSGTPPNLTYAPNANVNGTDTFSFKANDGKLDSTPATVLITITPVNDPPTGTDKTLSMQQDTAHIFAGADFGFSDPSDRPANSLLAVKVTTLPGAGSLTLAEVAVSAGQFIPAGALGTLAFTPASGATGSPYASFTFQVQDDGGTANGGMDLDPNPKTMTINVLLNHPPVADNQTLTTLEDKPIVGITLTASDLDGDPLSYQVVSQPSIGTLTGAPPVLTYTPNANRNGVDSFTFKANDGKADSAPATVTINITPVNDPPTGANNLVNTMQDAPYHFAATDFGFTDPNDTPANSLLAVKVTTLPGAGSLTLAGSPIAAGQFIPAGALGTLAFRPANGATGSPYASFSFQVQDDGGTANGGIDLDPNPKTLTIIVSAPPSANLGIDKVDSPDPVRIGGTVTYTLRITNYGPVDAQSVVVTDRLPTATTYVSASGAGVHDIGANTVTWRIPSLASGAPPVTLQMTISVDRVCRDPSFTNTAMVSSATPDSDLTNNQATQQTTIFAVVGTPGNDYLVGTQLDDLILGLDGNDMIFGLGGSDVICGGPGNDFIRAGAGDDTVFGGSGDDVIFGEAGDDTLFGNDGNDQIWGGLGNDAIYGDKGDDSLAGDLETFVNGRYSADPTDNRGGSDYINGGAGNDLIYGQGGDDCFRTAAFPQCPTTAFAGADHASRPELFGADGVDRINGGPGIDRLDGGAGDGNVLVGGPRPPVADFCSFGGTDVRDVTCVYPTPSGTAKVRWRTWQWPAA